MLTILRALSAADATACGFVLCVLLSYVLTTLPIMFETGGLKHGAKGALLSRCLVGAVMH